MKKEIHKIISDSYNKNVKSVPWSGMHDIAVNENLNLIKKKKKTKKKT